MVQFCVVQWFSFEWFSGSVLSGSVVQWFSFEWFKATVIYIHFTEYTEYVGSEKQGEIQGVYRYDSVALIRKESSSFIISFDQFTLTFNTCTHTCMVSMHFKNTSLKHRKKEQMIEKNYTVFTISCLANFKGVNKGHNNCLTAEYA